MDSIMNALYLLAIICLSFTYCAPIESSTDKPTKDSLIGLEKTEVTLQQAINIVEKRRLTDCVARTICELSCNPESKSFFHLSIEYWLSVLRVVYGPKGKTVYQTLKQFESDTLPKLTFYKNARDKGQGLAKTQCSDCFKLYPKCKSSTETLLRLANALTIKS